MSPAEHITGRDTITGKPVAPCAGAINISSKRLLALVQKPRMQIYSDSLNHPAIRVESWCRCHPVGMVGCPMGGTGIRHGLYSG